DDFDPALGNHGYGVSISGASGNIIGGAADGAGNLIIANVSGGIAISGKQARHNDVQANDVLSNTGAGVSLANASDNVSGAASDGERGNRILSNSGDGVLITAGSRSNWVRGNILASNSGSGITLLKASGNLIGGTEDFASNLVSLNSAYGIIIL